jgi:hypothetical protein
MELKLGILIQGVTPELLLGLMVADSCYREMGYEMTVTEIMPTPGSNHKRHSDHNSGNGADLRTKNVPSYKWSDLTARIQKALNGQYFVALEEDHIHVSYRPVQV